jgi:TP901 family phage tail tape measure protein
MSSFASPLGTLGVTIEGDITGITSALDKVVAEAEKADAEISRLDFAGGMADSVAKNVDAVREKFSGLQQVGEQLSGIGTTLTLGITTPLLAVGAASLKASGDFESAMNKVEAQGDITGASLDRLKAQAEELGAKTQFSSREAAEGMAELASAGMKTEEIYAAMPGVLNLAAAAGTSVGQAAGTAKDLLGQFGLAAAETGRVVDVLAKAGTESSGTLTEMANSLTYVGPVAHSVGMTLEETSAALIVLDQAGIRGEKAGTGLRSMLTSLLSPSKDAAERLAELGIRTTDASGKFLPLAGIMEQFRVKLAAIPGDAERSAALIDIFGEAGQTAANILTQKGAPALLGFEAQLKNVDGTAQKVAETTNKGLNGALERLKGSAETAAQTIGEFLSPYVISLAGVMEQAANKVAEFARWFQDLPGWVQNTALAFVALAAAIGPALFVVGQLAQAFVSINAALPLMSKALGLAGSAVNLFTRTLGLSRVEMGLWGAGITIVAVSIYKLIEAIEAKIAAEALAKKSQQGAIDSLTILESKLRANGADIRELKKAYDEGTKSEDDYRRALIDLAKKLGDAKGAAQGIKQPLTELQKLQEQLAKVTGQTAGATGELGKKSKQTTEEMKPLVRQMEVLQAVSAKLHGEHKKLVDAAAEQFIRYGELKDKEIEMLAPTEDLASAMNSLHESMAKIPPVIREMFPKGFIDSITEITAEIPPKVEESLDEVEEDTGKHHEKTKSMWEKWAEDVKNIAGNFLSNVMGRLIFGGDDTNKQLDAEADALRKSLDERTQEWDAYVAEVGEKQAQLTADYEEALEEENRALAEVLGERAREHEEFVTEANEDYGRESAELEEALAERVQAYEEYEEEVAGHLEAFRQQAAEKLADETSDLMDALAERQEAYDDFVEDANRRLNRLGEKTEDNIEDETRDTQRGIREKKKDYDRYAQDVARKIEELRKKNGGQVTKEEEELRLSLARRKEDLDQYIADQQADLAEYTGEQKKHQAQEEEDVKLSLERRGRDHDEYIAGVKTKFAENEQAYKDSLTNEEKEQFDSLGRKKIELDNFVIANKKKQDQLAIDHKAALDKEEQDYDQFVVDVTEKSAGRTAKIKADYEADTATLQTELAKQKGEYEKFVTDITGEGGKLDQIREAHRTLWNDIAELGKGAFKAITQSMLDIVSDEVMKSVFDALKGEKGFGGVKSAIRAAGDMFKDIFGIGGEVSKAPPIDIGGAAGGAGSAGGGGAGAAAGAVGSGLAGIVTAVASVVTAISSLIQNFQLAKMETTLNEIEHSTRYSMMYLGERADGGIIQRLYDISDKTQWIPGLLDGINEKLINWLEPLHTDLTDIYGEVMWTRVSTRAIETNIADIRGYLETTRNNTTAMKDAMTTGATWTVQFQGDPIASMVGQEIMRQLRLQGVNLV